MNFYFKLREFFSSAFKQRHLFIRIIWTYMYQMYYPRVIVINLTQNPDSIIFEKKKQQQKSPTQNSWLQLPRKRSIFIEWFIIPIFNLLIYWSCLSILLTFSILLTLSLNRTDIFCLTDIFFPTAINCQSYWYWLTIRLKLTVYSTDIFCWSYWQYLSILLILSVDPTDIDCRSYWHCQSYCHCQSY